jgi:septal ring factor EnvC (AmiA/AmiB activator)
LVKGEYLLWKRGTYGLLPLLALVVIAAHPARPSKEGTARHALEQSERASAREQGAQREALVRAAAAAARAQRLTEERIAAAARLRQAETATAALATEMDELAARQRRAQADLAARAETMEPLLPLIERLSLFPAETLLAVPASADDTLRGVLVLRGLAGELGQEALALRDEQARLAAATEALQSVAPRLAAAQARQQAEASVLDSQIATAQTSQREATDEAAGAAARAAVEAARAETLRGVLAELETQRQRATEQAKMDASAALRRRNPAAAAAARERQAVLERPVGAGAITGSAQPHGQLTAPVAGTVVRAWGDATEAGPATGLSYQAAPAARVVSPCGGRIAFAEQFRSYGLLLIINCGGGYHAVLAGFDRLDVRVGQAVATGEPVGVMPNWPPGTAGKRPTLYIELRRNGQPVDPAPWLRASS